MGNDRRLPVESCRVPIRAILHVEPKLGRMVCVLVYCCTCCTVVLLLLLLLLSVYARGNMHNKYLVPPVLMVIMLS